MEKIFRSVSLFFPLVFVVAALRAEDKFTITVTNDLATARPAEVIVVPWKEIASRLPGTLPSHLAIKDASGVMVPDQLINFHPQERHDYYDSIIFQHNFAAGEHSATFTIEKTESPIPPFPIQVYARYIPERFEDFAWENDRVAHRMYGQALETSVAGKDEMISSGIDVWLKRVRYPIIDRWYLIGHYHEDTGEGLDMYDVGLSRGDGGTGIWDGHVLRVSRNWKTRKILAYGPIRVIFDLTYEPWDAGNGVMVTETKRFIVDAGHNLDDVTSTFNFQGVDGLTVALGLAKHEKVPAEVTKNSEQGWLSIWEKYSKASIGCAVMVGSDASVDFVEDELNDLLLTKVKSGQPLHYYLGACWDQDGDFATQKNWNAYLASWAARTRSPLKISFEAAP